MEDAPELDPAEAEMFLRAWHLGSACHEGERLEVDGVLFDLAHPKLDRNEWSPSSVLGSMRFEKAAPRLLFPWTSQEDRFIQTARGEATEVSPGDTVLILNVQALSIRSDHGRLDHPHHQESRWAVLGIRSPNGKTRQVPQAWEFRGTADVMSPLGRRDYFRARLALYARLSAALEIEDLETLLLADDRESWPPMSSTANPLYRQALDALWFGESKFVEEAPALFGYLMGRAEASEQLLPLAAKHAAVRDGNRRNARKPRRGGEETRDAALSVIAKDSSVSRKRCAERVAVIRSLTDIRSIEERIAEFFEKGSNGRFRPTARAIAEAGVRKEGG